MYHASEHGNQFSNPRHMNVTWPEMQDGMAGLACLINQPFNIQNSRFIVILYSKS